MSFVSVSAMAESLPDPGQPLEIVDPGQQRSVFHPGDDPDLDEHMLTHDRAFYGIHAHPFGIGLSASYKDEVSLGQIRDWLDQDSVPDFEAFTGKHPYEALGQYEGPNLGLRGGGASPGTAFRYIAFKREYADAEELERARADVVKTLEYLPVVHVITGIPGGIGRGAMLLKSKGEDEPLFPGGTPTLVPLFDEEGNPLPPGEKTNGTLRPDNSGGILPEGLWYWEDSCSKDQLVGWVAAMATIYDATVLDPDIDPALVDALRDMACAVGAGLRVEYPFTALDGKEHMYDLVIMDADGRPSKHHDLNPLSIEKLYMPPGSTNINVFNLIMGLGIVKGLYHVCGDEESERFLYEELLGNRDYLGMIPTSDDTDAIDYLYMGTNTNFSNVNMIAIALFLNIYFEKDPMVLEVLRDYMENRWWDVSDVAQSAGRVKQPFFMALYEAMTDRGTDPARTAEAARLLKLFTLDPYASPERINCDEDELVAGECLAIDGETVLTLDPGQSWGDDAVATEPLDPDIRPPSNFDARSNPFKVNGGGGTGLGPGGDLHAAYWMLRYLPEREQGMGAMSPKARVHMPVGGYPPQPDGIPDETSVADVGPGGDLLSDQPSGGDGCGAGTGDAGHGLALVIFGLVIILISLRSQRSPR